MATILVRCCFCNKTHPTRKSGRDIQTFFDSDVSGVRIKYVHDARKPDVKGKIVEMSMNSSGDRESIEYNI